MSVTRTTSQTPNGYVSGDNTPQVKVTPDPATVQACPSKYYIEREYYISLIMREKGVTREVAAAQHDFFN
jgi:hypothetical protein